MQNHLKTLVDRTDSLPTSMVRAAAVADAGCKGGTLFRNRERSAEANSDTAPDGAQRKIPQLEAAIGALLAILESRLDRGELTGQDPIIALAREHIDQAVACGMERNFRKRLDAMIGGLTGKAYPDAARQRGSSHAR
jgi:hypothetical protein